MFAGMDSWEFRRKGDGGEGSSSWAGNGGEDLNQMSLLFSTGGPVIMMPWPSG